MHLLRSLSVLSFLSLFYCRYKLHQHSCIRTLWPHICLVCSIPSWHSGHITISYFWCKFQWQIIHLPSWSSGQSLVINHDWISLLFHWEFTYFLFHLAASFIFVEALPYSWYIWSGCWFSLSPKCARHPQNEGYYRSILQFALLHCCTTLSLNMTDCCSHADIVFWFSLLLYRHA
jgi:hypothetical protein